MAEVCDFFYLSGGPETDNTAGKSSVGWEYGRKEGKETDVLRAAAKKTR